MNDDSLHSYNLLFFFSFAFFYSTLPSRYERAIAIEGTTAKGFHCFPTRAIIFAELVKSLTSEGRSDMIVNSLVPRLRSRVFNVGWGSEGPQDDEDFGNTSQTLLSIAEYLESHPEIAGFQEEETDSNNNNNNSNTNTNTNTNTNNNNNTNTKPRDPRLFHSARQITRSSSLQKMQVGQQQQTQRQQQSNPMATITTSELMDQQQALQQLILQQLHPTQIPSSIPQEKRVKPFKTEAELRWSSKYPWFMPNMSRQEAEEFLSTHSVKATTKDAIYVVRKRYIII